MSEGTKFKNGPSSSPLFDDLPPYGDPCNAEIAALRVECAALRKERDELEKGLSICEAEYRALAGLMPEFPAKILK